MKQYLILIIALFVFQKVTAKPTFEIDYDNNQFLKDGKPFRYIAGDLEYFKVPRVLWRDRLIKHKASGLNTIQTYIEWALHEPERGVYNFEGDADVVEFIKLAHELGFVVIARPGPFIDAERDFGGLPYWLLNLGPNTVIRSSEKTYLNEVDRWFSVLLPKLEPLLYINGGPIIMVQLENEYGGYYACDINYIRHLRDVNRKYLGNEVVLFSIDGGSHANCSKNPDVFSTVNFAPASNPIPMLEAQRKMNGGKGPYANTEFWTGWYDLWETPHSVIPAECVARSLDKILAANASVVLFPLIGGTSFGFMAGANGDDKYYQSCVTGYDFDAPFTEAADPKEKYWEIRKVIAKYVEMPDMPLPKIEPKMSLHPIELTPISSFYDDILSVDPVRSVYPKTFEQLNQAYGYILYSTNITLNKSSTVELKVKSLGDRAQVYINREYQGLLSHSDKIYSLNIEAKPGATLDILVENQGRIDFGNFINESKGFTSNVTLDGQILTQWDQRRVYSNWSKTVEVIESRLASIQSSKLQIKSPKKGIPHFYAATFQLPNITGLPLDTFLRLDGWSKGVAFINGFNLGRYWPVMGPQVTLYTPAHLFKPYPQQNSLVLFEQENSPLTTSPNYLNTVQFVEQHVINGTVGNKTAFLPKCPNV